MGRYASPTKIAREMIACGFSIYPVDGKKIALTKWSPLQYNESRLKPEASLSLAQRFERRGEGVAILHGETNRTLCLDADSAEAAALLLEAYPDAPWRLLSGKGAHVIFAIPAGVNPRSVRGGAGFEVLLPTGKWLPCDIRAQGQISIAPGSWHAGKKKLYQALAPWTPEGRKSLPVLAPDTRIRQPNGEEVTLLERVRRYEEQQEAVANPRQRVALPRIDASDRSAAERSARAYMEKVGGVSVGRREGTAFVLACTLVRDFDLDDDVASDLLLRWNARNSPPLGERELLEKVANARRYGQNPFGKKLADRPARRAAVAVKDEPPEPIAPFDVDTPEYEPEAFDVVPVFEPDPEPEHDRASRRKARPMLSVELKIHLIFRGLALLESESKFDKRLGNCMIDMASCGMFEMKHVCKKHANGNGGHGLRRKSNPRCEDPKCPYCSRINWRKLREFAEMGWSPDGCYLVEIPIAPGDGDQADAKKADVMKLFRNNIDAAPRIFKGWSSVLCIFDPDHAVYAREKGLPEGCLMPVSDALDEVARVWLSEYEGLWKEIERLGTFEDAIRAHPWLMNPNRKRTSAGAAARKKFPWTSQKALRDEQKQRWKTLHPGVEYDECDALVPDGKGGFRPCCCTLHTEISDPATGQVIMSRVGVPRDRDVTRACRAHVYVWAEVAKEGLFTAEA